MGAVVFTVGLAAVAALAVLARRPRPDLSPAQVPSLLRGLALAGDAITAPLLLAACGAVYTWGYDGLAVGLGLGGGLLLLQLLVVPLLPAAGARSVPDYFEKRYGGALSRALARLIVVLSMAALLIALLMTAGLCSARLLGVDFRLGVAIAAALLMLLAVLRGAHGAAWIVGAIFAVLLLALLAPLAELSASRYGVPIPQIAYTNALWQIQSLEETLLEQDLADPAFLRPMLRPFLTLSPLNFLGLTLAFALGLAALPSVLERHVMPATSRAARSSAVLALLFAVLLITAAPALAAYAKLALTSLVADKTPLANLPAWVFAWGSLGLVEICGRAATDAATVAGACAALPDGPSVLRLQDLVLAPDMIALATPEMTGLGEVWLGILAAAVLAAALLAAEAPLAAIVEVLGPDEAQASPRSGYLARSAAAAVVIVIAGAAAASRIADLLTLATWALTLSAVALCPALVGGLWWRRANAPGAAAAMLAGLAAALFYLIGTRYFAVGFFETFGALSGAGPMARETFGELKEAWAAAVPGPAKDSAWAALEAHAQLLANWWGIKDLAATLIALPVSVVALVVVSLAARPGEKA